VYRAVTDRDGRIVRLGLAAAAEGCPEAAVPSLVVLATRGASPDVRLAAIKALGGARGRAGTDALLALVTPRKQILGLAKRMPSAERRAAVAALKGRPDARVQALLAELGEA
jgi:hypothetical protein